MFAFLAAVLVDAKLVARTHWISVSLAATQFSMEKDRKTESWGLIAGNGRFPFLVLEGARSQGIEMAVIALKEEASSELENLSKRLHWVSLGELSKTIDLLHQEGVTHAVMAGQVKHNKIFSSIRPDWKLAKLLFSLERKNTNALIGAVSKILQEEGILLVDSTLFLKPLVPHAGVLTRRVPDPREVGDIAYGMHIARQIAAMDLGQTVVICDRACVAIEAMEGTDETIARAGRIASGRPLVVVKVSKPNQDMRFDVPVVGLSTVEQMIASGVTALAIDAERTLLFDREKLIELAEQRGLTIKAFPPVDHGRSISTSATPDNIQPRGRANSGKKRGGADGND
ncbi:MAG: UDP-2,3-diacylglucosamine diphosphatase LpxI [Candidatus Acidiferrum sp.]